MSAPPLITVTRQYAAGGSDVARLVAGALGWTVIDNEFVDEVARRAGLPPEEVAQKEERAPSLLTRIARNLAAASSAEMSAGTTAGTAALPEAEAEEATILRVTDRVIREAATHGRAVLVGRGAQAVLAERPNALHVYLVASKAWRMKLAVDHLGVDPAQVERVLEDTDRDRDRYVKAHYGRARQDASHYDLTLNTERLGFEGAADVIVSEAKRRHWT
ncbi:MAG TPA: cytidylate kinase-like family protein [Gemmatimonadales bacterium]|nr:cytidylate kinase-like family protein [Gemmatimonadales bacterium]